MEKSTMMRKFFVRRFWRYVRIMCVPVFVLMLLSGVYLSYVEYKNIQKNSEIIMNRTEENIDLIFMDAVSQHSLILNASYVTVALKKVVILSKMDYGDYVFLNTMLSILRSIETSNPYIDSIYLYLNDNQVFVSSTDGITSLMETSDCKWMDYYREKEKGVYLVRRTIPSNVSSPEEEVVTAYQRITGSGGLVVVNFNARQMKQNLNNLTASSFSQLLLLNDELAPLLSTADWELEVSLSEYMKTYTKQEISGGVKAWAVLNDEYYFINIKPQEEHGIYIVNLISIGMLFNTLLGKLLIFLACLLLGIVLVFLLARKTTKDNFRHIDEILEVLKSLSQKKNALPVSRSARDEFDIILNTSIEGYVESFLMQEKMAERENALKMVELAALQMQINPHFLFNTLQIVDFEVLRLSGAPNKASMMIELLSDILKYALDTEQGCVSMEQELDYLRKYVKIQSIRFRERFIIYYDYDESVQNDNILKLTLQPLIENSIQHGIRPKDEGERGVIKLKIFHRNEKVHVSVTDNGVGMCRQKWEEINQRIHVVSSENIGLANVNMRLVLKYGEESAIRIQSREGRGTSVSFEYPME